MQARKNYETPEFERELVDSSTVLCASDEEKVFETSEGVSLPGFEEQSSFDNYSWD